MRHRSALYLTTLLLLALAGCASTPPSKFYILSPVPAGAAAPPAGLATAIGVGPVALPNYLDRPQIAVRTGANELRFNETHRWAEVLQENVANVLAENLARLVPTDRIALFPWGRTVTVDFQVTVQMSRFDADENGNVVLSALWRLYREQNREIVVENKAEVTEPVGGAGYPEIVAAQSRALATLSREIADAIRMAASR